MIIGTSFALQNRFGEDNGASEKDTYISYLPSAHVFEQAAFMMSVVYGMKVGFYSGNVLKLTSDLEILKPTFLPAVPRLLNSIYGKIKDKLGKETGVKKLLIDWGIDIK
jgi:long-chain acyl-CoA synthetase